MTIELLERNSTLSAALGRPLPLAAQAGEVVLERVRGGRRYVVYCGHHANSSSRATARLLRKKLRDAREIDELSFDASPLSGQSLSDSDSAWSSVTEREDCGDGEFVHEGARVGYELVVYAGRSPVGYCTFVMFVEGVSASKLPSIEVEVLEIWVAPLQRGVGVGAALAESVAELTVAGLVELDSRLSVNGAPTLFSFLASADIHSSSGAHYLRTTLGFLREKVDELGVLFAGGLRHVLFDDIELELR